MFTSSIRRVGRGRRLTRRPRALSGAERSVRPLLGAGPTTRRPAGEPPLTCRVWPVRWRRRGRPGRGRCRRCRPGCRPGRFLLSTLRRSGPPYRLTTGELADRSLVTAGAVTQRVDRAQGAGLVRRLPPEPGTRAVRPRPPPAPRPW
ncbi:MarR family transcriptional regulator [Kitasatospora herbaricolor]